MPGGNDKRLLPVANTPHAHGVARPSSPRRKSCELGPAAQAEEHAAQHATPRHLLPPRHIGLEELPLVVAV
jgi:hypothetical protein